MKSRNSNILDSKTEQWVALALCAAVIAAGSLEHFVQNQSADTRTFAPGWIPFAAGMLAMSGIIPMNSRSWWLRVQRALLWCGILLMVWTANGLPFDFFSLAGLMPISVYWPGMVIRTLALAATVMLVRLALRRPTATASTRPASWYGYAAFLLALPYPILRTFWALGGTPGLTVPGAAGIGFIPWLASIPWLLAAALSLLLVSTRSRIPRKLLLAAGWSATAIVAMVGPSACWSLVSNLMAGDDLGLMGIATWVPCLFYSSWLLWAIAAGAATYSYQLRSAK